MINSSKFLTKIYIDFTFTYYHEFVTIMTGSRFFVLVLAFYAQAMTYGIVR